MNKSSEIKPTLGVVAISYNCERDMPGFLDCLYEWVDEIIIVDDGSTDSTCEIAEARGAKVKLIVSPRVEGEYFSHQRNKGIDAANSDWLIHMDIDERVTPMLADEILVAISSEHYDAYRYRRLNFFLHRPMKGGGWQDWNLVHLAKRKIFRFGGMFHEDCLVDAPEERIGQLSEKMWHLNDDNYLERMNKSNLYCQEQMSVYKKDGLVVKWYHFLNKPLVEFANKYFRKKGYRDGTLGVLFALHSSCATFRACALLWDDQNKQSRQKVELEIQGMFENDE